MRTGLKGRNCPSVISGGKEELGKRFPISLLKIVKKRHGRFGETEKRRRGRGGRACRKTRGDEETFSKKVENCYGGGPNGPWKFQLRKIKKAPCRSGGGTCLRGKGGRREIGGRHLKKRAESAEEASRGDHFRKKKRGPRAERREKRRKVSTRLGCCQRVRMD